MPYKRNCIAPQAWSDEPCGKPFEDYTGRRKYCDATCRSAAFRAKHRPAMRVAGLERRLAETLHTVEHIKGELAAARRALEKSLVSRLEGKR